MIVLNNIKFAESEKEMIDSIFHKNGSCSGYAKRLKHKINLFDLQKNLIAVINQHGVLLKAKEIEGGKYWYSYADIPLLGEYDQALQFDEIEKLHVKTEVGGKRHFK